MTEEVEGAMQVLATANVKMEAMKEVKRSTASAGEGKPRGQGATDGKSACEQVEGTGCAQEIIQRFSDVFQKQPELLAKFLLRMGVILNAVKPASEPTCEASGQD